MSIVFHKRQKEIFLNSLNSGTLSHSYIIEGQAGIGKKTFALFAAKAILCGDKANRPCGKCNSCKKADKLMHPDLQFISASESGSFKVEAIRDLIKTVYYLPNESDKKVYILDMAHKMTASAQNALLKVFEEPPASAVFFILTEKRDALLPTVLSRGQIISLLPPDDEEIISFLREKNPIKTDDELKAACETAGNVPGAALKNCDKASCADRERAVGFAQSVFSEKAIDFSVYTFLLPTKSKRENVLSFLDNLICVFKELLVCKLTGCKSLLMDQKDSERIAARYDESVFLSICDRTLELYTEIENNGNLNSCIADYCSDVLKVINN